jgi:serine/threonine-protein kinase
MGIVYLARHSRLDRLVALKVIHAGPDATEDDLARFRAEAAAVARLQHPNIVQIYEVGEAGGISYLALEYVAGGSLDQQLTGTPQPPREAARLVEVLAQAIEHAHEQGIVHRDLKPANVLLRKEEGSQRRKDCKGEQFQQEEGSSSFASFAPLREPLLCKITDFGLAKQFGAERLTLSGEVLGTPSYMAPEQAEGQIHRIGPAADTYALGAILYELLVGRPPFKSGNVLDTLEQVRSSPPVSPRQLVAKLPRDLETICLKCLGKRSTQALSLGARSCRRPASVPRGPAHPRPSGGPVGVGRQVGPAAPGGRGADPGLCSFPDGLARRGNLVRRPCAWRTRPG